MRTAAVATCVLFAALAIVFFTQDPIEARHRPWTGPHVSEDGWYYYYYVRSAVLDGDLDLDNEYRDIGNWYGFGAASTGRRHNPFGIGPAIFWAPGFIAGHAVAQHGADGMTHAEQTGALFTSFLAAAAAFWISFRLARRYTTVPAAWLGTALAFLGGPVVWYAIYSPSMPHALEALGGAAFLAELLPFRRRPIRGALRLGAIGGAMMLVRPQLALLFALVVCEWVTVYRRSELRAAIAGSVAMALAALLVFSPQLLVWKYVYGSFVVVPQGAGFLRLGDSMWLETLFSSRNGLFTTTPLLWFVMPGLYLVVRRDRMLGVSLIAAFLVQAYVNGAAWDWWGGGAFGGRRFAGTFTIWSLALAFLVGRVGASERFRGVALAFAVAIATPLLALQWRMIAAHHDHRFSWETAVPFDDRVRAATGVRLRGYSIAGNPFAFPANAFFALRYGVSPAAYDRAVGPYLLDERVAATNPLIPPIERQTVSFAVPRATAFIGRGFDLVEEGAVLREEAGEIFVPLNRPGSLDIDVMAKGTAGGRGWTFNGHPLAGPPFHVEADWVTRGINRLGTSGRGLTVLQMTLTEGPEWRSAR